MKEELGTVKDLVRQQIGLLERERNEGTLAVAPARYAQEVLKMLEESSPLFGQVNKLGGILNNLVSSKSNKSRQKKKKGKKKKSKRKRRRKIPDSSGASSSSARDMPSSTLLSGSAEEAPSNSSSDSVEVGGSDSSDSEGSGSEKEIEHLLSPKLSDHTPKYYTWGGELGKRLPEDFAISSHLSLGKALRICLYQSGTNARPIPALFGISPKHVKDVSARRYFNKAKVVCRFMMELICEDEAGRTLEATFLKEPSVRSLNALVDEAQKRILDKEEEKPISS